MKKTPTLSEEQQRRQEQGRARSAALHEALDNKGYEVQWRSIKSLDNGYHVRISYYRAPDTSVRILTEWIADFATVREIITLFDVFKPVNTTNRMDDLLASI